MYMLTSKYIAELFTANKNVAAAGAAQVGYQEAARQLPEGDRGSHPQGGSRRAAVKRERYRHRKATETDRPA